jgi:aryl-alcohol dehydrogenase-like predicted oxidoreductase
MRYRTNQGERISEIGIGGYALSGVYGKKDPEQFPILARRAFDLGVTFFDVADVYGPAEEILGRAVASFRKQVWLATKVGWGAQGKPDCSAEHVLASCEQSLRRLQTDWIDLYQIHFDDPDTPAEETVGALEQLKTTGKIRYFGVGHLPPARMQAYIASDKVFSALVELSPVARRALDSTMPLCRAYDVGILAFSPTGRGLLTGSITPGHVFEEGDIRQMDPLFQRERFTSGLRILDKFKMLGAKYGKSPAQVAIAWVLAQPGVVCTLAGPSTIPHLEENLGGSGWNIACGDLADLEIFFKAQDAQLKREQLQSVRAILSRELTPASAFTDLVYVLETAVETGLVAEEQVLPHFVTLWAWRKQQDDATALEQMRAIQTELCGKLMADRQNVP